MQLDSSALSGKEACYFLGVKILPALTSLGSSARLALKQTDCQWKLGKGFINVFSK